MILRSCLLFFFFFAVPGVLPSWDSACLFVDDERISAAIALRNSWGAPELICLAWHHCVLRFVVAVVCVARVLRFIVDMLHLLLLSRLVPGACGNNKLLYYGAHFGVFNFAFDVRPRPE